MAEQPGRRGKASPLRVFKTVFWSFFGVRRRADNQTDFAGTSLAQVIIAGIAGAAILVITLVLFVTFIVG